MKHLELVFAAILCIYMEASNSESSSLYSSSVLEASAVPSSAAANQSTMISTTTVISVTATSADPSSTTFYSPTNSTNAKPFTMSSNKTAVPSLSRSQSANSSQVRIGSSTQLMTSVSASSQTTKHITSTVIIQSSVSVDTVSLSGPTSNTSSAYMEGPYSSSSGGVPASAATNQSTMISTTSVISVTANPTSAGIKDPSSTTFYSPTNSTNVNYAIPSTMSSNATAVSRESLLQSANGSQVRIGSSTQLMTAVSAPSQTTKHITSTVIIQNPSSVGTVLLSGPARNTLSAYMGGNSTSLPSSSPISRVENQIISYTARSQGMFPSSSTAILISSNASTSAAIKSVASSGSGTSPKQIIPASASGTPASPSASTSQSMSNVSRIMEFLSPNYTSVLMTSNFVSSNFSSVSNEPVISTVTTVPFYVSYALISPSTTSNKPMSSKIAPFTSTEVLVFDVSLAYADEFNDDLNDKESLRYLQMQVRVEVNIRNAYKENANFVSATVTGFTRGSVISNVRIYFKNSSSDVVDSFKKTLSDYGKKAGFEVEKFQQKPNDDDNDGDNDNDDDNDDDMGLDGWQIGLIIAGVIAFCLLITVIALCCKISSSKKKAKGYAASSYAGPFYDTIDEEKEMRTLRASPTKLNSGTSINENLESNQIGNMYSTPDLSDGLVRKTTSNVGNNNEGADVDENDYVSIIQAEEDVIKL